MGLAANRATQIERQKQIDALNQPNGEPPSLAAFALRGL